METFMIRNYLTIAFRNIVRHKVYSIINISGLAIGMACCMLILFWVKDELSYDKFNKNFDDIYRVVENQYYAGQDVFPVAVTPGPLAETLKNDYPEIINSCRLTFQGRIMAQHEDLRFYETGVMLADPSFLDMFSLTFLQGDSESALDDLNSIIISESISNKYFNSVDPIGKMLTINSKMEFLVQGVFEDLPQSSHLKFKFIAPFLNLESMGRKLDEWGSNSFYTYVQLQNGITDEILNPKISHVIKDNNEGSVTDIYLQPLGNIHLKSDYVADIGGHGDILYVNIFSVIALFVLAIACINFMNLSTARSGLRTKEIGIRKVLGSSKQRLFRQFIGESFLMTAFSLLLAFLLVEMALPYYNDLLEKEFSLLSQINPINFIGILSFGVFVGIAAGLYPAIFLSSFNPSEVLKFNLFSAGKGSLLRKTLVIVQFSLSIILIISSIFVARQILFIQEKKLGFDKDHVMYINMNRDIKEHYPAMKDKLVQFPSISAVTATSSLPTYMGNSSSGFDWDNRDPEETILFHMTTADYDYLESFGMSLSQGRFYMPEYGSDSTTAVVINEKALAIMGIDDPIGKRLSYGDTNYEIIGIVKDFHFKPVKTKIEPLVMIFDSGWHQYMIIKVNPGDVSTAIDNAKTVFQELNPSYPFEYNFLDQDFNNLYTSERYLSKLISIFTIMAVIISCLGLFGLSAFISERRTKEIGIRKVLGANVSTIVFMLSQDFTKWIIISNIIAWPLAYWLMDMWLDNFAYRVTLGWWVFILSGLLALIIAIATVGLQTIKVAITNPITALRYE
jgi:ABC-type antimicrobial peptide transport system permease subunit